MRKSVFAPLMALVLASGCVHTLPSPGRREAVRVGASDFRLEYEPADAADAAMVRTALVAAAPRLARWGGLRAPVRVVVVPSHEELERAASQSDLPWLRAWARRDLVLIQAPTSWENGPGSQLQLNELVVHELAHCVMYQQSSDDSGWQRKRIPIWFREGLASVTADQGYKRGSLVELRRRLADGDDPLDGARSKLRHAQRSVYSAGHHAFVFLLRHHGEGAVRQLFARMREGADFDQAFASAFGLERSRFEDEFRGFLRAERWRGNHDPVAAPVPDASPR